MGTLASVFKALSDEARLRIINLLVASGELCVCDIEEVMGFTQTKVSRHLAYLRKAGLVDDRRQGLWMLYSIARPKNDVEKQILTLLNTLLRSNEVARKDAQRLSSRIRRGCCTTYSVVKSRQVKGVLTANKN
jgi:ArsR family transcriptional regulator